MTSALMSPDSAQDLLQDLIGKAKRAGADAADALLFDSTAVSMTLRLGRADHLERAESRELGLRVLVGKSQSIVSTTDFKTETLNELVERAIATARAVPKDPYCGLADPDQIAREWPDLDQFDPTELSVEMLTDWSRTAEEAARAVEGVTNSEGASASWMQTLTCMVASNGFAGTYKNSRGAISAAVLAGSGTGMERDSDFTATVYAADLEDPAVVGRRAGERAVRRLNPRKVKSCKVPVVYDPEVSRSLVRILAGAIGGPSITRGTSFLKDRLGEEVFASTVNIVDDPHIRRGLRSRPFDSEGIATGGRNLIEDGRLTTWLLDLRSARQLGLATTGHATRGIGGPPSPAPTNLYMAKGAVTPEDLIGDVDEGLYVTDLMGMGVNGVTGDYSQGAAGFWIERGKIAYPVSELTIAGNLKDMFRNLVPANDLILRYGIDAPTVRVDGMTVAGT